MDKLLERHKLWKLCQEEIENLNKLQNKVVELVLKTTSMINAIPDGFTTETL